MSNFAYTSTCCIAWERWRQMSLAQSHQRTLNSLLANRATGRQRQAISANDSRGRGKSVSFLAANFPGHHSEAVVALDTAAPSMAVENRACVCVCVCSALRRALLQDNRARRSLPHLSPESPTPAVERRGTASDGELTLNHPTFHLLCLGFICGLICNITPFALTDEPAVILKAGQWHKGLKLLQPACNIWASVAPSICTLNGIYRSLQLFTVIHAMENIWDEHVYQSCRQSFLEIP